MAGRTRSVADSQPQPATQWDLVAVLRRSWHYILLALLCLWLLHRVRAVLGPFIVGLVLAYIVDPWLDRLERRGWSRDRAIVYVFLVALAVCLVVGAVVFPMLLVQAQNVGTMVKENSRRLEAWIATMPGASGPLDTESADLATAPGSESQQPEQESSADTGESGSAATESEQGRSAKRASDVRRARLRGAWDDWYRVNLPGWVPEWTYRHLPAPDLSDPAVELGKYREKLAAWAQRMAASIGSALVNSLTGLFKYIFTPFIAYYFMREIDPLRRRVRSWIPARLESRALAASEDMNKMLASYFRGQLLLMFLVFWSCLLVSFGAKLWLGVDHIFLVAAVDGLLYCIPIAGAWIASITAAVVGFVTADGNPWLGALVMFLVIQVVNGVFDQVVSPRVSGHKVGLHPLVVIFAILAGAALLGFVGMLVAVPVAASIKILLRTFMPEVVRDLGPPQQVTSVRAEDDDGEAEAVEVTRNPP